MPQPHDHKQPAYQPGEHPNLPPPATVSGVVGWVYANFLSSPFNFLLTAVTLWFLWLILPPAVQWFFIDAAYTGADRNECLATADGACWAFVNERLRLFTYGFYPAEERWRVNLSFVLLCLALVPVLFDKIPLPQIWALLCDRVSVYRRLVADRGRGVRIRPAPRTDR